MLHKNRRKQLAKTHLPQYEVSKSLFYFSFFSTVQFRQDHFFVIVNLKSIEDVVRPVRGPSSISGTLPTQTFNENVLKRCIGRQIQRMVSYETDSKLYWGKVCLSLLSSRGSLSYSDGGRWNETNVSNF